MTHFTLELALPVKGPTVPAWNFSVGVEAMSVCAGDDNDDDDDLDAVMLRWISWGSRGLSSTR